MKNLKLVHKFELLPVFHTITDKLGNINKYYIILKIPVLFVNYPNKVNIFFLLIYLDTYITIIFAYKIYIICFFVVLF